MCQIQSDDPLPLLTADQEKLIHQELAMKISEIEQGLSTLPRNGLDKGVVPWWKTQSKMVRNSREARSQSRPLDLLEVYCSPNSQITQWVNKHGGHARRFSFQDGDLNTREGVQKLWLWIYIYEPRHIWLSPECRLWGKFANLNMFKSQQLHDRIVYERIQNRNHLKLCNEIFLHQNQYRRHTHLEQPDDPAMLDQKELHEFVNGSFRLL